MHDTENLSKNFSLMSFEVFLEETVIRGPFKNENANTLMYIVNSYSGQDEEEKEQNENKKEEESKMKNSFDDEKMTCNLSEINYLERD